MPFVQFLKRFLAIDALTAFQRCIALGDARSHLVFAQFEELVLFIHQPERFTDYLSCRTESTCFDFLPDEFFELRREVYSHSAPTTTVPRYSLD